MIDRKTGGTARFVKPLGRVSARLQSRGKNESVTRPIRLPACDYLHCAFGDRMEATPDERKGGTI